MAAPAAEFAGYASLFGLADAAGDVVMPGAFRDSLARRGTAGVRMLFQHDPSEPVGVWLELREDARGLFARGRLTPAVQRADELARLLADGAIDGLSIGFRTLAASRERATGRRRLMRLDLWEISIVSFPMLAGARVLPIEPYGAAPRMERSEIRGGRQSLPGLPAARRSIRART